MPLSAVHFKIVGTSPYSQSRRADLYEPKKADESHDEYDERTWRLKAHVGPDGDSIVIPAHGIHQSFQLGAQKGRLRPGAAESQAERLAGRIATGIMLLGDATTNIKLSQAKKVAVQCDSNGKRGGSKRVTRRFPEWSQWEAEFDAVLLDETLTIEDMITAARWAGLVAGIGRFRAGNGGHNGRFTVAAAETYTIDMAKAA